MLRLGGGGYQDILPGNILHLIEVGSTKFVEYYVVDFCFSFGLVPGAQLHVPSPLPANQSSETSLLINTSMFHTRFTPCLRVSKLYLCFTAGPIQRMDPLANLQVAVKNNIDVFYFSCIVPMHVFFIEAGQMGKWCSSIRKYITCSVMHLYEG